MWCCELGASGAGSKLNWPPDTTGLLRVQVFGDKDADGFYRGEGGGRTGYIPCNMVSEVTADSPAGTQQLLQRGYLSPDVLVEGSGMTCSCPPPTSCHHSANSNTTRAQSSWYVWSGRGACLVQSLAEPLGPSETEASVAAAVSLPPGMGVHCLGDGPCILDPGGGG